MHSNASESGNVGRESCEKAKPFKYKLLIDVITMVVHRLIQLFSRSAMKSSIFHILEQPRRSGEVTNMTY